MPDILYPIAGDRMKRLRDMGDGTVAEVEVQPSLLPGVWANPANAFDCRQFADVEIQVIGAPTTAYVFQDSFDGVNFNDCAAFDKNGTGLAAVSAVGRYRLPGSSYLKARAGAGATIMIRAGS